MSSSDQLLFVLSCFGASFAVCLFGTAIVRRFAASWGLIDRPSARKVHIVPTPLGGGLGIWLGVMLPLLTTILVAYAMSVGWIDAALAPEAMRPHIAGLVHQSKPLGILLIAATTLTLLGLADDRRGLPWPLRMFVQIAVATACVLFIEDLRLTAFLSLPLMTAILTLLWIVALINSFNMLDNMDGLSAGLALIAAGQLAAIVLLAPEAQSGGPQLFVGGLLLIVAGAAAGFLWHNRPPAAIFMGDAGSYLLGFLLAVGSLLATYVSYGTATRHAVLAPLCVFAVPLYDMTTVIAIRLRAGRSPFEADKNHFSHRLVDLGLTKPQAVLTIHLLSAACGLGGMLLHQVDAFGAAAIGAMIVCLLGVVGIVERAARHIQRRGRA